MIILQGAHMDKDSNKKGAFSRISSFIENHKKLKFIIKWTSIIGIVSLLIFIIVNVYVGAIGNKKITSLELVPEADAAVILGALVRPDGNVSSMLADRLDVGYNLYNEGKVKKILVTGDHGKNNYNEVTAMKKYLMDKGVRREDIFMDHAGFDTYDSLVRAKKIFKADNVIVVSQEYHLVRALYISEKIGLEAYGVAALNYNPPKMPYYQLREYAACIKSFIEADIIRPDPKYLGEEIPISGNGIATEDDDSKEIFDAFTAK
jgi:vancomycin permeability regulator SanA